MAFGKTANLFVFVLFSLVSYFNNSSVHGDPHIPCYFIFGDSLVDSGNNNYLNTTAKADYPPYGIDFPYGPTGRFCNGRTVADITGQLLGFDHFIPPFLHTSGSSEILKGVNYGSSSAGIRNETGKFSGVNIDLNRQLQYHQVTISRIVELLHGNKLAVDHLNKCLYLFVIGSNDVSSYFMPQMQNIRRQYTPQQYANVLIEEYSQKIKKLYSFGARMVALNGVPPIGCTPSAIATYGTNGSLCVDKMNNAANLFNDRLKSLVHQLNKDLRDAKFMYLNTYETIFSQYISSGGRRTKITSCCQVNQFGLCIPDRAPCQNRKQQLFWDAIHPTEATNQIAAQTSFRALRKIL